MTKITDEIYNLSEVIINKAIEMAKKSTPKEDIIYSTAVLLSKHKIEIIPGANSDPG